MENFYVGEIVYIDIYEIKAQILRTCCDEKTGDGGILCEVVTEENEFKMMSSTFFEKVSQDREAFDRARKFEFEARLNNKDDCQDIKNEVIEDKDNDGDYDEKKELDDLNYMAMAMEVERGINRIIQELGLVKSDLPFEMLRNCCLLHKYMAKNNVYNENIMKEKESYFERGHYRLLELYNGVVKKEVVCTTSAIMFKEILGRLGIKAELVGLLSTDGGRVHMANLVWLDGEYYFF